MKRTLSCPAIALLLCSVLHATPEGTGGLVREINGEVVTVATAGPSPAVGDGVEFFFEIGGLDEEISVASGKVISLEGNGIVKVKVEKATGEIVKDQMTRFTPGKGGPSVATTSTTPPANTPKPAAATPAAGAGYIGVQVKNGDTPGALVMEATAGGPAATASVLPNDLIVALDGSPVENMEKFVEAAAQLAPGSRHALLVMRDGKLRKIELTVGQRPADFPATTTIPLPDPASEASPAGALPPSVPFPSNPPTGKTDAPSASEKSDEAVAAPYITKGNAQYTSGNIQGAIASYSEGIRAAPSVATLYLNRANAYLYQPNFKAAVADTNKALDLKIGATADAYVVRGTAKAGLGEYDAALADCNRALKINPQHALAYNNRGNNKLRQRNYQGALADCNKAIALNPDMALPYYNRGFARTNLGDQTGALADWKKAVAMQASFGAELNPKIAQLEASGVRPKTSASGKKSAPPTEDGWVDLTNAPQKIVGTWQGGRHCTQYFADGTFVTDPHLVPNPPRGQWQVQGDRLVEFYPQANRTTTHNILALEGNKLVLRNAQGETFRKTRLSK